MRRDPKISLNLSMSSDLVHAIFSLALVHPRTSPPPSISY